MGISMFRAFLLATVSVISVESFHGSIHSPAHIITSHKDGVTMSSKKTVELSTTDSKIVTETQKRSMPSLDTDPVKRKAAAQLNAHTEPSSLSEVVGKSTLAVGPDDLRDVALRRLSRRHESAIEWNQVLFANELKIPNHKKQFFQVKCDDI